MAPVPPPPPAAASAGLWGALALLPSGASAASRLLGKPCTYQKSPGSWDQKYPLPKTEKSVYLAHYFSGVTKFCVQKKNKTTNVRGLTGADTGFLPGVGARRPVLDWCLNVIE